MERWAKSVNAANKSVSAAKAVQQQQLQAVLKAEAQIAPSAPTIVNLPSLTATTDFSTKSGIALTAALKEVSSKLLGITQIPCTIGIGFYSYKHTAYLVHNHWKMYAY